MTSRTETACIVKSRAPLIKVLLSGSQEEEESQQIFHFMLLPFELRLKIYGYLLPPRRHIIVNQTPYTGYFYNTLSLPASSYPFGRSPSPALIGYRVLSQNQHRRFPSATIFPAILRTCKRVRDEAEPVLYAGKHVEWDFGIHLVAAKAFWNERSQLARESVRTMRIAKEFSSVDKCNTDVVWSDFCSFILKSLPNVQSLDLKIWSSSGSAADFPGAKTNKESDKKLLENEWRKWSWTHNLLLLESLRELKVTNWDFGSSWESGEKKFDSWRAQRMVTDKVVRERMIRGGGVIEQIIVLPGLQA